MPALSPTMTQVTANDELKVKLATEPDGIPAIFSKKKKKNVKIDYVNVETAQMIVIQRKFTE